MAQAQNIGHAEPVDSVKGELGCLLLKKVELKRTLDMSLLSKTVKSTGHVTSI